MRYILPASFLLLSTAAWADVPRVATDIAPVHSLVSQVMAGVGTPDLTIPPGASPHSYAMRPSEARALAGADLVVWVGHALTPWMGEPIDALAGDALHLELEDVAGTLVLKNRAGVAFEAHDHDDDHDDHAGDEDHDAHDDHADNDDHADHDDHADDEGHDDHADDEGHDDHADDEGHDDHADDDDHADHDDHADDDGHNHAAGAIDPHLWLDPVNASLWLGAISDVLGQLDPENADIYAANAAKGQAELSDLQTSIQAQLSPLQGRPFAVFHDAYHYFEARFGVEASAALSLSDGSAPSAARLAEVREVVQSVKAVCVFTEPQFNPGLVAALAEGGDMKSAPLDPLGAELTPGPALYGEVIQGLATSFTECLSE
ncbi:zinc ABC transporter substrate-binding protein [Sulfitobacter sp.]|jgi:zinc transport system substrate-binding protein|uniref:zinc ABC transporter substrate-binding protein n=1 Tax=Sulfitobacter sp. TaxID=1903071 RepID=UPI0039E546CA